MRIHRVGRDTLWEFRELRAGSFWLTWPLRPFPGLFGPRRPFDDILSRAGEELLFVAEVEEDGRAGERADRKHHGQRQDEEGEEDELVGKVRGTEGVENVHILGEVPGIVHGASGGDREELGEEVG